MADWWVEGLGLLGLKGLIVVEGLCFILSDVGPKFSKVPITNEASNYFNPGYCPHTVAVYERATVEVLAYVYYQYDAAVAEWGVSNFNHTLTYQNLLFLQVLIANPDTDSTYKDPAKK